MVASAGCSPGSPRPRRPLSVRSFNPDEAPIVLRNAVNKTILYANYRRRKPPSRRDTAITNSAAPSHQQLPDSTRSETQEINRDRLPTPRGPHAGKNLEDSPQIYFPNLSRHRGPKATLGPGCYETMGQGTFVLGAFDDSGVILVLPSPSRALRVSRRFPGRGE